MLTYKAIAIILILYMRKWSMWLNRKCLTGSGFGRLLPSGWYNFMDPLRDRDCPEEMDQQG